MQGQLLAPSELRLDVAGIQSHVEGMNKVIEKVSSTVDLYSCSDEVMESMNFTDCKNARAALNAEVKEYDTARKQLKAAIDAPYKAIEAAGDAAMEPLKEQAARYALYATRKEEERKAAKLEVIEDIYTSFAGVLADVVPFERILDPKWLNATVKIATIEEAIEGIVSRAAADLKALRQVDRGDFASESDALFFRTLSLADAIKLVDDRKEEAARIAALDAQVAANRAAEPEPQEEPAKEYPQETQEAEESHICIVVAEMTVTQKSALITALKAAGISGRIIKAGGTVEAVSATIKEAISE